MGREARKYGKNTVKPGFGQGPPGHGGERRRAKQNGGKAAVGQDGE